MATVIDAQGISEELGVSLTTTYKLLKARKVPCYKVGDGWRSTVEELDRWRERQLTLSGIMATDQFMSECSKDYMLAARDGLIEDLNNGLSDRMDYEALRCLESARKAVEAGDTEQALRVAARAVAAIEVWGRE